MAETIDPGPLPELAWLPVDRLAIDATYQRTIDNQRSQKLIARIAENFTWAAFGAVQASPRGDGKWLLLYGQHRVEAVRRRGNISHVPAVVLTLDQQSQARAFIRANDRAQITANELFYARLAAGDPEALTISRLCRAAGVEVTRYQIGAFYAPIGKTPAIAALYQALHTHGEVRLGSALRGLTAALGKERGALGPYLIGGTAAAAAEGMGESELTSALKACGMAALAKAISSGLGATGRRAAVRDALMRQRRLTAASHAVAGVDRARLMAGR